MDPDLDPKRRHSIDLTVACPTNHVNSNHRNIFDQNIHHFAWDLARKVTKPRSIILVVLWSIWRHLGGRPNYLGFQPSSGAQAQQRVIHLVDHLFTDPPETLHGGL